MLEKLAKQTAIYGISTIVVRLLNYLLSPYYTRIFSESTYGIVTDVYALIPFALVILSMGMESAYFRFAAKAEAAGGDVREAKRRLFATTWGATSFAAAIFAAAVTLLREPIAAKMGAAYVEHPSYIVLVGLIVMFDIFAIIPFSRLREQGRAFTFVGLKALNVIVNLVFAIGFGFAGLYDTPFGVGWVFVANLAASTVTWCAILTTTDRTVPIVRWSILSAVLAFSLPLLLGNIAGTANEFIDRQMIKYLIPTDPAVADYAMQQLGIYGAITKIAVVMTLFTQIYRLAAEPFFLSNFKKEEFIEAAAAAMKYYIIVSMLIFMCIGMYRDLFALIVGRRFRVGIDLLPVILASNVLSGVWLNLSFWYKREEKTRFAVYVTFVGLAFTVAFNFLLVPRWEIYGAAWARFVSECAMVATSIYLNRRFFPTPYKWGRMAIYVAAAMAAYFGCEAVAQHTAPAAAYVIKTAVLTLYVTCAVKCEKIDVKAMVRSILKRG